MHGAGNLVNFITFSHYKVAIRILITKCYKFSHDRDINNKVVALSIMCKLSPTRLYLLFENIYVV